jgi:hypothetical protein
MGKREPEAKDGAKARGDGGGGGVVRLLAWLAMIAGGLYIALAVVLSLPRTREAVAGRLEMAFGTPVAVGKSRLGLPLTLVLENVASEGFAPGKPGFVAREVRVTPVGFGRWEARIRRGSLVLVRGADGAWEPASFSRLGELPVRNLADLSAMTAAFRQRVALDIGDCSVRWLEADGREVASVLGATFTVTPVKLPDRVLFHHVLSLQRATAPGGATARDVEREWLSGDGMVYRELPRRAAGDGGPDTGAFWEGKNQ